MAPERLIKELLLLEKKNTEQSKRKQNMGNKGHHVCMHHQGVYTFCFYL